MVRPIIPSRRSGSTGPSAAGIFLAVVPFLVAACSGGTAGTDRNAAMKTADMESASPSASGSLVQGVTKDVNWCFTNNAKGLPFSIYFGSSGQQESYYYPSGGGGMGGPVDLTDGATVCSSGGFPIGVDRSAHITFHNKRETEYALYNQAFSKPMFYPDWHGQLTPGEGFAEGQDRTYEFHYNKVSVKRLPDTGTIEFRITYEGEIDPA